MSCRQIQIKNYRCLADVTMDIKPINVLFGPNGSGKSSFLDTIWFVRDCSINGVDSASSNRSHGIGLFFDGTENEQPLSISIRTQSVDYELQFGLVDGRILPFVGECLTTIETNAPLIQRKIGDKRATFNPHNMDESTEVSLQEPDKPSLATYVNRFDNSKETASLNQMLHFVRYYDSRWFDFPGIRQRGSEFTYKTNLLFRGQNIWSVLQNLNGKALTDERYNTIIKYMKKAFPSFRGLSFDQTGPNSVIAAFVDAERTDQISASGVSDGYLQMLILLTALFCENQDQEVIILLDEPEISLHPWAIAVLAEAIEYAAQEWNRQFVVATHSPVFVSQFSPEQVLATTMKKGRTIINRVSEIPDIQDLLEQYSVGSLYMAQLIAPQTQSDQNTKG